MASPTYLAQKARSYSKKARASKRPVNRFVFARTIAALRREKFLTNTDVERGAVTAEYAIVIMAALAFAGLLVVIMKSPEIQHMLFDLVSKALK